MAEKWQQWYPHNIDSWQGSANVQSLGDLAYRAVHNLIMEMWKQEDCALPSDDKTLSKASRVFARWKECKEEVLDYFQHSPEDEKITHPVLLREFLKARELFQLKHARRVEAGKRGAKARWENKSSKTKANPYQSHSNAIAMPMANDSKDMATVQDSTGQNSTCKTEKQKTARENASDPRFTPFKDEFFRHTIEATGIEPEWDGRDGNALARYLASSPKLTVTHWIQILANRARSEIPQGERLCSWIADARKFYKQPLDRFSKPIGAGNGHQNGTFKSKTESSLDAAHEAIRIIRGQAGVSGGDAGEAGYPPPGEAESRRLLGSGG